MKFSVKGVCYSIKSLNNEIVPTGAPWGEPIQSDRINLGPDFQPLCDQFKIRSCAADKHGEPLTQPVTIYRHGGEMLLVSEARDDQVAVVAERLAVQPTLILTTMGVFSPLAS